MKKDYIQHVMQFEVLGVFEAIQYTNTNASRVAETLAKHVTIWFYVIFYSVICTQISKHAESITIKVK